MLPDFPIADSHVHLLEPARCDFAWTAGAPPLKDEALPADLFGAALYRLDR